MKPVALLWLRHLDFDRRDSGNYGVIVALGNFPEGRGPVIGSVQ